MRHQLWTIVLLLAVAVLLFYAYSPESLDRDIDRLVYPVVRFVPDLLEKVFGWWAAPSPAGLICERTIKPRELCSQEACPYLKAKTERPVSYLLDLELDNIV